MTMVSIPHELTSVPSVELKLRYKLRLTIIKLLINDKAMELLEKTTEEKKDEKKEGPIVNGLIIVKGESTPDGLDLRVELRGMYPHEALGVLELAKQRILDRTETEEIDDKESA